MEIILPDGRKAVVIGEGTKDMVRIRLEDGREVMWPKDKLPKPEGEETLKVVKIPAIDRLTELEKDRKRLGFGLDGQTDRKYKDLLQELRREAAREFIDKWGLT